MAGNGTSSSPATSSCCFLLMVMATTVIVYGIDGASGFYTWEEPDDGGEPCDEIYRVREGETLQTISAKCRDPFILEENPYIQEDDDVYPGLTIKITPYRVAG